MNAWRRFALCTLLVLSAVPAQAGIQTILSCDFDAEPLDVPIGNGGAALGQPVDLGSVPAHVRSAPMATPSLEMVDDWGSGARSVRFHFLNDQEIQTGIVDISVNLWCPQVGNYSVAVREHGTSTTSFTTIHLQASGQIRYSDSDTVGATQIGMYPQNALVALRIVFDLDQDTYDVHVDGLLVLDDEGWAATTRGVGALLIGHSHDADASGVFSVDDILVTSTESPSPVEGASWARVKSTHRE